MANQNQNRKSPLSELTAISPLDGRYWDRLSVLSSYFSEYSLMKYRVLVEIEYFIELCSIPLPQLSSVDKTTFDVMRSWYKDFSEADALKIKSIEKVTNHDVKVCRLIMLQITQKQTGCGVLDQRKNGRF